MTAMLPHALRYYDSGLSVIPDKPRDKRPDLPAWECFTHERASRQTLVDWWTQKPSRNIGIITGDVSGGLVCLDFDAIRAFECYCAEFPHLLNTRIHLSGSHKGYHAFYYVSLTPRSEAFNTAFGRVEVRANGMQVVAPPSIHPSGNPYSVHARQSTMKIKDVSTVVDWLKFNTPTLIPHTPRAYQETPANLSHKTNDFILRGAAVGERNERLFRAACDCAGNGLPQAEAEALLVVASGLPTIEAKRTVASAYKSPRIPARPPRPPRPPDYKSELQQAAISDDDLQARLSAAYENANQSEAQFQKFKNLLSEYELRQSLRSNPRGRPNANAAAVRRMANCVD